MEMSKFFQQVDMSIFADNQPASDVTEPTTETETTLFYVAEVCCGDVVDILGAYYNKADADKHTRELNKNKTPLCAYETKETEKEFPTSQKEITFSIGELVHVYSSVEEVKENKDDVEIKTLQIKEEFTMENKIKVLLAPTAELAQNLAETMEISATVEAEYGEICIEGKVATLAHHGSRSHNPAPCNWEVSPMETGNILISHIDLDTVGGVLALMGLKPEDTDFWKEAEFIDVNGTHHIHELSEEVQNKLNAIYAWNSERENKRITEVTDVTEDILSWLEILNPVLGANPDAEWIAKGKEWAKKVELEVESKLVSETEIVRAFITDGVFCTASYYSPTLKKVCKATVTLNTKFNAITVAFADGGSEVSAREIVQDLWGSEAGGRDGIAGSPRSWSLSPEEVEKEFRKAVKEVYHKLYVEFMCNPENSHRCENCPENQGFDSWEGKLPCGQQNCWVDCHCNR